MNTNTNTQDGPLAGITILDFCQLAQGPFATQILGDMGADIIKIEPIKGEWMRSFSLNNHYIEGESLSFLTMNRNKRSVALDLKKPAALEAIKRLVPRVDAVVENFRPGVMDRLGLGYETLKEINPRLVFCASCGLGHEGPYVKRPGQDMLIQAMSGLAMLNGRDGESPYPAPYGAADFSTGLHIAYAVLAGIIRCQKDGQGQRIDLNLWSSLLHVLCQEVNTYLNGGGLPIRPSSAIGSPYLGSPYGIYATQDGHIALGMNPLNKVARLIGAAGYEDVSSSNVMENRDAIHDDLARYFLARTTADWLDILLAEDIWCAPVNSFAQLESDPQVVANKILQEFDHPVAGRVKVVGSPTQFSRTPTSIRRPPPQLGEHTAEVLREFAGMSSEEIQNLINDGAAK